MRSWQDRAWLMGLGAAVLVTLAGLSLGLRPWSLLVPALSALAVGAGLSINASLARLDETARKQRTRSIAIGLVLAALVAIFYAATIIRLGGNVMNRPI